MTDLLTSELSSALEIVGFEDGETVELVAGITATRWKLAYAHVYLADVSSSGVKDWREAMPQVDRTVLTKLYEGVSEGKLALDGHLAAMIQDMERRLKAIEAEIRDAEGQRELPVRKIGQEHAIAFGEHAKKILYDAGNPAARIYFRSLVSQIVIKPDGVQIGAANFAITAAASRWDGKTPLQSVPSVVTKWRARRDSNSRPSGSKPDALSN